VRLARAVALVLLATLFGFAASARAQTSEELVKATFMYRFASFVTWPPQAFADAESPIRLCVIGADPFAQSLSRAVAAQRVNGRGFEVRRLVTAADASQCQMVYVVGDRVDATLRAVRGQPVLTITDGAHGAGAARGIIHFVIVEDHVRFHIDDASAAEGGMPIDPRLLSLALSVRRRAAS
jgi:hypothetical protein